MWNLKDCRHTKTLLLQMQEILFWRDRKTAQLNTRKKKKIAWPAFALLMRQASLTWGMFGRPENLSHHRRKWHRHFVFLLMRAPAKMGRGMSLGGSMGSRICQWKVFYNRNMNGHEIHSYCLNVMFFYF